MKKLPEIQFLKKVNIELEFEIFTLESLISRKDTLKHSLENHHRVEFHNIIYFTKGSGTHYVDFQPYKYYPGSILFVSKGQVHAFKLNTDCKGYITLFTEDFLSKNLIHSDILSLYRLYNYHLHNPIIHQKEISSKNIYNTIFEMYEEYNSKDDFAKEETLRLLLKLLLLRIERIKQTLTPKFKNSEWISNFNSFKSLVERNFTETRNAKDYAGMMNISYKHLNEICKSITGNSAKKFIDIFVILEIKRSLAISDLSVNALTYDLGFDEPTNLIKFFKKHTQQSPTRFKQMLKK